MLRWVLVCWLLVCGVAQAQAISYEDFARLPILHEGRVKPLNTFALVSLQQFHGSATMEGRPPIVWLAEVLFDPATAVDEPIFLLKDADAQAMLGLPTKPDHLYSFSELAPVVSTQRAMIEPLLEKPSQELSPAQRAVVTLYQNIQLFSQMTLSMTPYLPMDLGLNAQELERFDLPQGEAPFVVYYRALPSIEKAIKSIVMRKGTRLKQYTPAEMRLVEAGQKLSVTLASGQGNELLRVMPSQWGQEAWLSPWALVLAGKGSPQSAEIAQGWQRLAVAYRAQDGRGWEQTVVHLRALMEHMPRVRPTALALEIAYYDYAPLSKALLLYTLGFLVTLLCVAGMQHRWLRFAAAGVAILAAVLHTASLAARIFILERPPVGTLYESLLFVSLIAVLFGLFLEFRLRNFLGILVATLAGSLLLLTSQSFGGDDTMRMLMAVLNTNFWLATHVLCITTGYGFGLVAGIVAHYYLMLRCRRGAGAARPVLRSAYGVALIALLFTALGTILGGIWADQSWGRFWGWDPKENGALMICLWLIWLLHGRISGHMQERGFAVGLALVNIVIALSWLGVNLLATGLHSYGFTDKAAWALAAFCAVEMGFAAVTYFLIGQRNDA